MTDTPKPDTSVETVELAQRAAIRAALEAAAKLIEDGIFRTKTPTYEGPNIFRLPSIIRSLSPDDILKRL